MATLRNELDSLQHRLTRHLRVRALVQSLILIFILLIGLGCLDYSFRPTHSLIRFLISSLFWIGAMSVVLLKLLSPSLRKLHPVDLAFAIEDLEGTGPGELAAAVDFQSSTTDEQTPSWKTQLVEKRLSSVAPHATRIRSRSVVIQSAALGVAALFLSFYAMPTVVIATSRVTCPTSRFEWPQRTRLRVFDQQRRPIVPGANISLMGSTGSNFYVEDVIGEPPEDVILEIRHPSQPLKRIQLQEKKGRTSDEKSRSNFRFRLVPNQLETMQFRIVGGDDQSMDWITLRKEIKPVVQNITCQIHPPEYLNVESTTLENVSGPVPAPVGSQLQFSLVMNRPIREFELREQGAETMFGEEVRGTEFQFALNTETPDQDSLIYELFVRTGNDFEEGDSLESNWQRVKRIRIEPIVDSPPEVTLLSPQQNLRVTRNALVPFAASTRDDHGLQALSVKVEAKAPMTFDAEIGEEQLEATLSGTVDLETISQTEGEVLELIAVASDRAPNAAPMTTSPVRISIVSTEDKEQDLQSLLEQTSIELLAAYRTEQDILSESQQLLKVSQYEIFSTEAIEKLQLLQVRQQGIQETLQLRVLEGTLATISKELTINQLDLQKIQELTAATENSVARLLNSDVSRSLKTLGTIRNLGEAAHNRETSDSERRRLTGELRESIRLQESISTELERILQKLDRWENSSDVRTQWKLILSALSTLIDGLSEVDRQTISRPVSDLTSAQIDHLSELSKQHVELSIKLQNLRQQMTSIDSRYWSEFYAQLDETQSEARLQNAAESILGNKILRATEIDRQLLEEFKGIQLQSTLRASQLEGDLKSFQEFAVSLRTLADKQSEIHAKWIRIETSEAILEQQIGLKETIQELAERAWQLKVPKVEELLTDSITQIDALLNAASENSSILERSELQNVDENLQSAIELINQRVAKFQEGDQNQLIEQLSMISKELAEAQNGLIQSFDQLQESVSTNRLSRSQRRQLVEFSQQEQEIAEKLTPFRNSTAQIPVLNESLERLVQLLITVSNQFKNSRTLPDVREDLSTIHAILSQLAGLSDQLANSPNGQDSDALPAEIRVQMTLLLQQQRELIRQEKRLLETGETIPEDVQKKFLSRQQKISEQLEELLKSIPHNTQ